jgi:hypothetical protein
MRSSFASLIMVRVVTRGLMLHALERHFLTAVPFRFQSLNIFSFLLSTYVGHVMS